MISAATKAVCVVSFASFTLLCSSAAHAGVFSSIEFGQGVSAYYKSTITPPSQSVITDSLPIHNTVSVNNQEGGSITVTYNVTDNGSVATLGIATSGTLNALYNSVEESEAGNGTAFTFSDPVAYSATISDTGAAEVSLGTMQISTGPISDATETFSGVIPAGYNQFLSETFGLSSYGPDSPANQIGSDSIQFTFTAIPEPSSLSLLLVSSIALLGRRKKGHKGEGHKGEGHKGVTSHYDRGLNIANKTTSATFLNDNSWLYQATAS